MVRKTIDSAHAGAAGLVPKIEPKTLCHARIERGDDLVEPVTGTGELPGRGSGAGGRWRGGPRQRRPGRATCGRAATCPAAGPRRPRPPRRAGSAGRARRPARTAGEAPCVRTASRRSAARGVEPAARRQHGAQPAPVALHRQDDARASRLGAGPPAAHAVTGAPTALCGSARARPWASATASSGRLAAAAEGRARTTSARPGAAARSWACIRCRSRRRTVFRTTALPTPAATTNPTRGGQHLRTPRQRAPRAAALPPGDRVG